MKLFNVKDDFIKCRNVHRRASAKHRFLRTPPTNMFIIGFEQNL